MCVQRFDDSLNSAIHTTYRISLRSSSMPEPRDPLLKVLIRFVLFRQRLPLQKWVCLSPLAGEPAEETRVHIDKGSGSWYRGSLTPDCPRAWEARRARGRTRSSGPGSTRRREEILTSRSPTG